jgi:hypothetical protein
MIAQKSAGGSLRLPEKSGLEIVIVKLDWLHGQNIAFTVLAAPLAIFLQADADHAGFWTASDGPFLFVLVGEVTHEAAGLKAHVFAGVGAHSVHFADFDGAITDAAHNLEGVYVRVAEVVCEAEGHLNISCWVVLLSVFLDPNYLAK